jgi:hypothetical protein
VLLDKHTATAAQACPSLQTKRVTPHTLRHTNAMLLRAEKVDIYTIALWLGHESTKSTEIYLHADNKLKQQAIDRTAPTGTRPAATSHPTSSSRSSNVCSYPTQSAQLVAECLRSYRTVAQGLSWRGAGSPYTPTTPPPPVKVGPSARALRRAPDGAPLTAVTDVVRLGHAHIPPRKAQLCEPEQPAHPRGPRPSATEFG